MMGQRKLTDEELQVVMDARFHVRQVAKFSAHAAHFHESLWRLDAMANHSTTDGKPYVDPEPPIPDSYRRAVAGDEGRSDCMFWSRVQPKWCVREPEMAGSQFLPSYKYIVPVDKIPTDDDAKSRPVVRVRDNLSEPWQKRVLIAVVPKAAYKFVTLSVGENGTQIFQYCRFPYPNETP